MTDPSGEVARPAPRVTVCIPVFNGEPYIAEAIRSVLDQTFADFEVLVSDNASTDSTVDIVLGFADPRVRLLRNETNIGAGRNYNRLLDEARGDFIKVLSADDRLLPRSLERMVGVLEDPANQGVVLVTARREVIDGAGEHLAMRGSSSPRGRVEGRQAIAEMVRTGTNMVGETSATLFRATVVERIGTFLDEAPYCVDMDYWFRMLATGDLYVIPEVLSSYRVCPGAWSFDVLDRQAADVIALLERELESGAAGVDRSDVRRGARAARRTVRMRRVFYAFAGIPAAHRQKIAYLFVGGWNTLVGYLVFAALWAAFGETWSYAVVLAVAYVISSLQAYWAYKLVVFKSSAPFVKEFPRFAVVYVLALLANLVAFPALTQWLGLNPYVGQAVFTFFLVIATYLANRHFSFRDVLGSDG